MNAGIRPDGTYWLAINGVELHRFVTVMKFFLESRDADAYPDAFISKIDQYEKKLRKLLEQREGF